MGKHRKGKKVVVQGEPKLTVAPLVAPAMAAANKKIKVLAYCDSPTCATGFGTVSRNIFEGLYKTGKYDIEVLGINYWGDPHDFPYKIWPVGTNNERDPYGRQKVLNMIPRMDFDLLFFLQDSFILDFLPTLLPNLKANRQKPFKSILYYPVDSVIKEKWGKNITQADYMVAYSEFGRQQTLKVLPEREDITVIPHGVNTKEYFPLPENVIKDFREKYFKQFANYFIITNVNRNQQRKDLPRTISAFKKFRETVPESILYLHMAMKDQGWDLAEVCKAYEMDTSKDVIFPSNFGPNQGYPRDMVNLIYNASDVVMSTTLGEGFGLCLHPETNIYTLSGVKKIKDTTIEDKVLSSDGSYNSVRAVMSRDHDGDIYEITSWLSNIPIKASPLHGFFVLQNDKFIWKKAQELVKGDCLLFPREYSVFNKNELDILEFIKPVLNKTQLKNLIISGDNFKIQSNFKKEENHVPIRIKLDADFCKLLGLYLAEGSIPSVKKDSVSFSFNKNEIEHIVFVENTMRKIFGLGIYHHPENTRVNYNGQTITFYSSSVANLFFVLCGGKARTKTIHPLLLNLDKECIKNLLHGLYIGDGHYSETNYEIQFSTTSTNIAYAIRLLLARLGILSSVKTSRVEYKVSVSGVAREKLANLFGMDLVVVDRVRATERAFINDSYLVLPIKSINRIGYKGKLVDIQVDNTNNFVAENAVVHNSWMEALSAKTPIIMPANTMLPEFITEETGYLCKSGGDPSLYTTIQFDNEVIRPLTDVNDLVKVLLSIYNDRIEAERRAMNGYKWINNSMDWIRHIVPQWVKVFEKAYSEMMQQAQTGIEIIDPSIKKVIASEVF